MKKLIAISMVLALLLAAGCSGGTSSNGQSAGTKGATAADTGSSTAATGSSAAEKSTADAAAANAPASDLKSECNVWTWESVDLQAKVTEDFNKAYPGIEIVFTNVSAGDMPMKLQATLASGGDMPQVCWIEISMRGKVFSLDCLDTFTDAPYNAVKGEMLDFMMPVHSTADGRWVSAEVSTPISGISYRRDLLKKYLGTDDPDEVPKLLTTWDDMYELGQKIKSESNGEVYLFGAIQELSGIFQGQRPIPYIKDGKLNIDDAFSPVLDALIRFYSSGLVAPIDQWSPEWNASFNEKTYVFNAAPTWYPTWTIKAFGTEASGNWAITLPPGGGFLYGGTGVAIPKAAKNKELGWAYLKWCYLSKEGAVSNRDNASYMTAYAPVWQEENFFTQPDDYFGGQDILKCYTQLIAKNMAATRPVTEYDVEVGDAYSMAVQTIKETEGKVSSAELLSTMREEIVNKVPELK